MIESQTVFQRHDKESCEAIARAAKVLHDSGIFTAQVEENALRIASTMTESSPEELAKSILQVQQTNRNLLALHEWAGQFTKEVSK